MRRSVGVDMKKMTQLVIKSGQDGTVKGDVSAGLALKEMTIQQIWQNNRVQLFDVSTNYAALFGLAIVKDGELSIEFDADDQ